MRGTRNVSVHWCHTFDSIQLTTVPFNNPDSLFDTASCKAVCILAGVSSVDSGPVKDVAESLQLFLTPATPERTRRLALRIIGRRWLLWQNYFNPVAIMQTISNTLQESGYTLPDDGSDSDRINSVMIDECVLCVQQIASQNAMLVYSALVVRVNNVGSSIDSRIASLKLLTHLMGVEGLQTEEHLPAIVGACVRNLSPDEAESRRQSEVSGTSLVTESTQTLAAAMSRYYKLMAFHKGQQTLAVAHSVGSLVVLVYDLRTGTLAQNLGASIDGVPSGSQLLNVAFNSSGRAVAGVVIDADDETHKWIVVWKLPSKFKSLLSTAIPGTFGQRSTSPASSASSSDERKDGDSTVLPRVIREFTFVDEAVLKWVDDTTVQVEGSDIEITL